MRGRTLVSRVVDSKQDRAFGLTLDLSDESEQDTINALSLYRHSTRPRAVFQTSSCSERSIPILPSPVCRIPYTVYHFSSRYLNEGSRERSVKAAAKSVIGLRAVEQVLQ